MENTASAVETFAFQEGDPVPAKLLEVVPESQRVNVTFGGYAIVTIRDGDAVIEINGDCAIRVLSNMPLSILPSKSLRSVVWNINSYAAIMESTDSHHSRCGITFTLIDILET